jgi:hypothetical protein
MLSSGKSLFGNGGQYLPIFEKACAAILQVMKSVAGAAGVDASD